jgi:hypothetical protein
VSIGHVPAGRMQSPAVSRCRARPHHDQAVNVAPSAPVAGRMSQRPGQNAAHCPGWPLRPQWCYASRCAGRACGAPLTPETSASPAGLTARARPGPEGAGRTYVPQQSGATRPTTADSRPTRMPACLRKRSPLTDTDSSHPEDHSLVSSGCMATWGKPPLEGGWMPHSCGASTCVA